MRARGCDTFVLAMVIASAACGVEGHVLDRVGPGDCAELGAVDEWQTITPPDVDVGIGAGLVSVVADPNRAGVVYVTIAEQGIYRSLDCGATWSKVNVGRYADELDTGTLFNFVIDPIDSNRIWAGSLYGADPGLLRSDNGGLDWDPVFAPGSEAAAVLAPLDINHLQSLSIDPADRAHLVISFHSACGAGVPGCLAETYDAGATWRLFDAPYREWVSGAGVEVLGGARMLVHTMQDGVFFTDDGGASWREVFDGSAFQLYVAADGYRYIGGVTGLHRSLDGETWEVADGPAVWALSGDGERMFGATRFGGAQYFARDELGGDWIALSPPTDASTEAHQLSYDATHHVLYSAQSSSGAFRMRTR